MKCTNKIKCCVWLLLVTMLLTACGKAPYDMQYSVNSPNSSFRIVNSEAQNTATPFAQDLCVVSNDVLSETIDMSAVNAAGLFSTSDVEVIFSKNAHEKLHPASLTKVMTALVALKYANVDDVMVASENVIIDEVGATVCGLKPGDKMTLEQALHILLIQSANDVAVMIAEHVAGSVEEFAVLMNEEAKRIGATNSNFVNPHGLTDANHYVTAYDMYLIFNEAVEYDLFTQIIHMSAYETIYHDKNGKEKEYSATSTNWYINGTCAMPANVNVLGGKTGTTTAARHCLILLSKDTSGKSYISIILSAESRDVMYEKMSELLSEIRK